MFEEPNERPPEHPIDPADRAREKFDEFRMHAEIAAVFEGHRKFDAELYPGLDPDIARDAQRTIARLEKSKSPDSPVLPASSAADAAALLTLPDTADVSTNNYHIYRRPGEVMMVRWLADDQVELFYERFQAHFEAALTQFREEERQTHGWKKDPKTLAYLAALDAIDVKMADRYLRDAIRKSSTLSSVEGHNIFVLSTQSADELDILHLCDYVMGVSPEEIVGPASAPPDEPTESDRAWFFKLFSLRGISEEVERMCFFAYLQKSGEAAW